MWMKNSKDCKSRAKLNILGLLKGMVLFPSYSTVKAISMGPSGPKLSKYMLDLRSPLCSIRKKINNLLKTKTRQQTHWSLDCISSIRSGNKTSRFRSQKPSIVYVTWNKTTMEKGRLLFRSFTRSNVPLLSKRKIVPSSWHYGLNYSTVIWPFNDALCTYICLIYLGVIMYTKDLTPKMPQMVDTHCAEVHSALWKGSVERFVSGCLTIDIISFCSLGVRMQRSSQNQPQSTYFTWCFGQVGKWFVL